MSILSSNSFSVTADFQGWLKMTLNIKTANFSIFRREFRKILPQSYVTCLLIY